MSTRGLARPLPRGMREVRDRVEARRERVAAIIRWLSDLGLDVSKERDELASIDRRLAGFTAFEVGE